MVGCRVSIVRPPFLTAQAFFEGTMSGCFHTSIMYLRIRTFHAFIYFFCLPFLVSVSLYVFMSHLQQYSSDVNMVYYIKIPSIPISGGVLPNGVVKIWF